MTKIVIAYVVAVLLKWGYEAFDWVGDHRKEGFAGWWADQKIEIGKKAFLHVFSCAAWVTGSALVVINAAMVAAGMGAIESVTPATTVMAAFMLDTLGKPLARRLRSKAAELEAKP